jgi:hypothetical protein
MYLNRKLILMCMIYLLLSVKVNITNYILSTCLHKLFNYRNKTGNILHIRLIVINCNTSRYIKKTMNFLDLLQS